MKTLSRTCSLLICTWAFLLLCACSTATPAGTAVPSGAAPTAGVVTPTATRAALIPTAATGNPERAIRAAYQRARSAPHHLKVEVNHTANFDSGTFMANQTYWLLKFEGDFKDKDAHVKMGESHLSGGDTEVEFISVGGKNYVHGPAPEYNAPEDKWYLLSDSAGSASLKVGSFVFDSWTQDLRRVTPTQPEILDGVSCDVYVNDRIATIDAFARYYMGGPIPPDTLDQFDEADMRFWVSQDGFLHQMKTTIRLHDPKDVEKKVRDEVLVRFSEFGKSIAITAPPGAVAIPTRVLFPTTPAQASARATAQPTAQALYATAAQWPVLVADTFDKDEKRWPVGEFEEVSSGTLVQQANRTIRDGKYIWDVKVIGLDPDELTALRADPEVTDFYLTAELKQASSKPGILGGESGEAGILFRAGAEGYYLFAIDEGFREFHVYFQNGPGPGIMVKSTHSEAIRAGETNRLTAIGQGSRFYFYINGEFVGSMDDSRSPRGKVGLEMNFIQEGQEATIEFDNVELRAPN